MNDESSLVWRIGDVILDLYEVTGLLGEGGMGTVFKVHHKGWNIDLAVKTPRIEELAKPGASENFVRECETWVELGLHPHIVSCYYVRTLGGVPRVFAEYIEGGSLSEWIRNRTLYEGGSDRALQRILDIAIQFAWGLQYAHDQGLVHLDVKPANVMMTPNGMAKVTDFGLTKARGRATEQASLIPGQSVLVASGGMTLAYCSPEQASGRPLSRKTDIWSWGLSVLEMFTGEVTWVAGQAAAEAMQSYSTTVLDPEVPPMPPAVSDLLKQCFARSPEDRPQSMREVAASLQAVHDTLAGAPYVRQEPMAAELSADSMNNRALSYCDLGKENEADAAWQAALALDPLHAESTYNRGLLRWRRGNLTDDALVSEISHCRGLRASHLTRLVHLERGDLDAARRALKEAAPRAPNDPVVAMELTFAESSVKVPGRSLHSRAAIDATSISLSRDSRYLLLGGVPYSLGEGEHDFNGLALMERATGQTLRILKGHTDQIRSVHLNHDARIAVSGSVDKTVRLWDIATGKCLHVCEGHIATVTSVFLSTDALLAVSGSQDKTVRLWNSSSGECQQVLEGHLKSVFSVCLSADGSLLLAGGLGGAVAWNVATGMGTAILTGADLSVSSVCLSADASLALLACNGIVWGAPVAPVIQLRDMRTGRCLREFHGSYGGVRSVSLSVDARVAASADGPSMRIWDVATGRCLRTFRERSTIERVRLTGDGRFAVSVGGNLTWWQLPHSSPAPLQIAQIWSYDETAATNAKGQAAMKLADSAIKTSHFAKALAQLRLARSLQGAELDPRLMDLWGKLLLHCRRTRLKRVWPISRIDAKLNTGLNTICLGADTRHTLTSEGNAVRLWETLTGRLERTLEGHEGDVKCVTLGNDGRYALSGGTDKTMRLWDIATGVCVRALVGHIHSVESVCLSTDSRIALSGSADKTVRLWDVATGRCLRIFEGHTADIHSVCLRADGRAAASGAWDGTVRLWDVATGRCLRSHEPGEHDPSRIGRPFYDPRRIGRPFSVVGTNRLLAIYAGDRHTRPAAFDLFDGRKYDIKFMFACGSICFNADASVALSTIGNGLTFTNIAVENDETFIHGDHARATNLFTPLLLSGDARYALSASYDPSVRVWALDWDLEAHDPVDWDDGARPYLEAFLSFHTPYADVLLGNDAVQLALSHQAKPGWKEDDFKRLLSTLGRAGYGWLRAQGIRSELERMAREWKEPAPLVVSQ